MKKNGQYVGVDEKYIPEEEKYVTEDKNNKKIGIGYLAVVLFIFIIVIIVFVFIFINFIKISDRVDERLMFNIIEQKR